MSGLKRYIKVNHKTIFFLLGLLVINGILYAFRNYPVKVSTTDNSEAINSHQISRFMIGNQNNEATLVKASQTKLLIVFLHGYGADNNTFVTKRLVNAMGDQKYQKVSVIFPSSAKDSFWHNRKSGQWEDYVIEDVLTSAKNKLGGDYKIAIGGISMGGYGAIHIAENNPALFCAVGGHSAAIWKESSLTAKGAFDDLADFEKNNVITRVAGLKKIPVWLDNGSKDWFLDGAEAFYNAAKANDIEILKTIFPGRHDAIYWDVHWPDYLDFYQSACLP